MGSPSTSLLLLTQVQRPIYPAISTLTDDFATQDTVKWSGWGPSVAVVGGRLSVTTTNSYLSATSVAEYDARDSAVYVEVPQVPNLGNGSTSAFLLLLTSLSGTPAAVRLGLEGGVMYAQYRPEGSGSWTVLGSATYSATSHRFWRVREAAGLMYAETSADGTTWATLSGPTATPVDLGGVFVALQSGFYGTEPTPGSAIFDNLNVTPATSTAATASGALTLGGTPAAQAQPTASGTITLGGTVAATARPSASGTLTLGGSATALSPVAAAASGSITLAGSSTAAARPTAAGNITLGGTSGATAAAPATSGSITLGGSATGTARPTSPTGAITLGGAPTARAGASAAGTITLSGTTTGSSGAVAATAAGSITLGGTIATGLGNGPLGQAPLGDASPGAYALATAAGSLTLGGTATGTSSSTNTATGSITLGGTATAQARPTAAGTITLGGTSTAAARPTAAGNITLGGSSTAFTAATATGSIILGGSVTARVPATAAGLLLLSGLANGTAVGADTYHPHIYGTATLAPSAGTAILAGNGVSTATLTEAAQLGITPLGNGALGGWQAIATATVAPVAPATATLTATVGTATLAGTGVGTAVLSEVPAMAELQLT